MANPARGPPRARVEDRAAHPVMACRVGDPDLDHEHFLRAARADRLDVRHKADDDNRGASAGGLWQATVFGFTGLVTIKDGYTQRAPMLAPRVDAVGIHLQPTRRVARGSWWSVRNRTVNRVNVMIPLP